MGSVFSIPSRGDPDPSIDINVMTSTGCAGKQVLSSIHVYMSTYVWSSDIQSDITIKIVKTILQRVSFLPP